VIIRVNNKIDLGSAGAQGLDVSVKTGAGLTELLAVLTEQVKALSADGENAILVRSRHEESIRSCVESLNLALETPPEHLEIVAEHLRTAAQSVGALTGVIGVEDVLDSVFREFCIGK
jgi:tRNA modification GTPase